MSELEIKEHYKNEMEKAETFMEKNLLKAEMNHKLKLVSAGEETDYAKRAAESKFDCVGCSA